MTNPGDANANNDVQPAERLSDKPEPSDKPQPELAGSSAGTGGVVLLTIATAVILSTVFYGLNSSAGPTQTSSAAPQSTSQSMAQNNAPKPPVTPVTPSARDVTPSNTQPGITTGAAPANSTRPTNPQSSNTPVPAPRSSREATTGTASTVGDAHPPVEHKSLRRQTSHSAHHRGSSRRVHRMYHSRQSPSLHAKSHSTRHGPGHRRR